MQLKETQKPIYLYGMGDGAEKILDHLNELGIPVRGIFASDGFVRHQSFRSYRVISYEEASRENPEMVILLCFGTHLPEVLKHIRSLAEKQELYVPDVPVCGGEIFDLSFARRHRRELTEVYNRLADDLSRQTFYHHVLFKLTGNPEHLHECETPRAKILRLLPLCDSEFFLDLGAYTGDTVHEWMTLTKGQFRRIIAVEPDPRSFAKLSAFCRNDPRVFPVHACIGEQSGTVNFHAAGGRNSSREGKGKVCPVACLNLDSWIFHQPITCLKMDIEGSEAAAIAGAKRLIAEKSPNMMIAAYHKSADLFRIPLLIDQINPSYKIYLRHEACLPAWDTEFLFVKS